MSDQRAFVFGPGVAYMTLQTYTDGSTPAHSFPHRIDIMQELSVDFSLTAKKLFGQNIYPEAIGLGEGSINVKAKMARFEAYAINDNMFMSPSGVATGIQKVAYNEAHTIPAVSGPYTVTITPPSSGTFVEDLGVFYASTGLAFQPVGSLTAAGQYTLSAGVYTFDSADASVAVFINYAYSLTSGYTVTVPQLLQGSVGASKLRYQGQYGGRTVGLVLPNCVSTKFTLPTKEQDFIIGEIDMEAFVDATGNVAYLYLADT